MLARMVQSSDCRLNVPAQLTLIRLLSRRKRIKKKQRELQEGDGEIEPAPYDPVAGKSERADWSWEDARLQVKSLTLPLSITTSTQIATPGWMPSFSPKRKRRQGSAELARRMSVSFLPVLLRLVGCAKYITQSDSSMNWQTRKCIVCGS